MTMTQADSARALVQVTHAARVFDRLVDSLIEQYRSAQVAPSSGSVVSDPAPGELEAELVALRERMDGLFPEFQKSFGALLLEHLGAEHAPETLAALSSEPVQRYFRARRSMEGSLLELMSGLSRKMSELVYPSRAA